jgi:hypothetical protein
MNNGALKVLLAVVWSAALSTAAFVSGYAYRDHVLFSAPRYTKQALSLATGSDADQVGVLPRGSALYDTGDKFEPPHYVVVLATKRMDALAPPAKDRGVTPVDTY